MSRPDRSIAQQLDESQPLLNEEQKTAASKYIKDRLNPKELGSDLSGSVFRFSSNISPGAGEGGLGAKINEDINATAHAVWNEMSEEDKNTIKNAGAELTHHWNSAGNLDYKGDNILLKGADVGGAVAQKTLGVMGKYWEMGHGLRSGLLQFAGVDEGLADKIASVNQMLTGRAFPKARRIPGFSTSTTPAKVLQGKRRILNITDEVNAISSNSNIFKPDSKIELLSKVKPKSSLVNRNVKPVKPNTSNVGLESFAIKTQSIINKPKGGGLSAFEILNQEGMVHNVFRDGTKAFDLTKPSSGVTKTDKQLFFTDIYDPEFALARKQNPKTPIPDMFRYGHSISQYQHPTGIMGAMKRPQELPEKLQKEFGRKYATFPGFNMSPHHFGLDDDLAYSVVSKVIKPNQSEVVNILNNTYSVYPANHPKNFMMSYHDNTALRYKQQIKQIDNVWDNYFAENPNATETRPSLKTITTLQKLPSEGKMIGGKELGNKPFGATLLDEIDMMIDIRSKGLDKKDWSSILPPNVKRKDLKFAPVVLGIDHQALIHGIGDRLPERLALLKLSKTKEWAKMTPEAQAREIAKVSRLQQNVALRISGMRLELIKKRMTELELPINDWTDIQVWMIQNPTEAASLNYHKILSEGVNIPMDIITTDLPLKEAQEIANVFNIEVVNKVGQALDARRAQVKEITRDIKGKHGN